MTGEDIANVLKEISIRRNAYLIMVGKDDKDELVNEFSKSFEDDVDFIREIRNSELNMGIVSNQLNEFEKYLMSLPSQVYSMIKIKEMK